MITELTEIEIKKLPHMFRISLALFFAKQAIHLTSFKEAHRCVVLVEKYLENKASKEECYLAAEATRAIIATIETLDSATNTANIQAAHAAANAAYAVGRASSHVDYTPNCTAWAGNYATNAIASTIDALSSIEIYVESKNKTIKEQRDYYNDLLNFDEIFEKEVLC